jgi:hypothetical protein
MRRLNAEGNAMACYVSVERCRQFHDAEQAIPAVCDAVREYLIERKDGVTVHPGSPFNIKQDSATLRNFTLEDVQALAVQHTAETGQTFSREAIDLVWDATRGQPWLTNALLQKCVWSLRPEGEPVEVVARVLSEPYQLSVPEPEFKWRRADGSLDMEALLRGFQEFWSWNSEIWEAKADYTEAFPHLLLMAYLQRIVNGGGRVEREYAAGRGRMDLAVYYGGVRQIIEIKLVSRRGRAWTIQEGLKQLSRYRDTVSPRAPAYLVVFDRPVGADRYIAGPSGV